jgi:glycosyltransferase involved in cell wall biosynthesis
MHLHLRRSLVEDHPEVTATFVDVPRPGLVRRLAAAAIPGLDRLDADLQPLRYVLAQCMATRRELLRAAPGHDVVHFYSQNAALLSAGLLRSMPAVVSTDTTNRSNAYHLPYRMPGRFTGAALRPVMALERRAFRAATLVVGQSEHAAADLERYGVARDRIRVIPFGITIDPLEVRDRPPGLPRVTFIGTTMDRKGGWLLLRAFQESLRDRCRLTLVTREPVPASPGVEVIRDAKAGDGVVARVLAETAVFALPTEIDKSPYSVLEAMAAGVPVVATAVGAIPEMVPDGVAGILIPQGDGRALSRAIESLLDDEDKRRRMGLAGRERVVEQFDARRTTTELLKVIEEARRRHRRR